MKKADLKAMRVGWIMVIVTGVLFWSMVWGCVGYTLAAFEVDPDDPKLACEKLIEYGWEVKVPECVKALTP